MGNVLPLIIQLVCGALGGNAAGSIMKKFSLGTLGNSIVGILGGGIGGQLLNLAGLFQASGGVNAGNIIGNVVSGGVGGGILMAIIGAIKQAMTKPKQ